MSPNPVTTIKKPPFQTVHQVAGVGFEPTTSAPFEGASRGYEFESYFADFRPPGYPYRVCLLIHGSNEPGDIKFWQ